MRETIKIQGKSLELSNLDKILWPKLKISKGEMIEYYISIAPYILPHLKNRPLSMKRFPDGVAGEFFFEKNAPKFTPKWVKTIPVKSEDGKPARHASQLAGVAGRITNYILVNNLPTLIWVANLACIEFHTWLSATPKLNHPGTVLFDLDPTEKGTFKDAAEAALLIKKILEDLGILSFAKTSGMRGLHIQVPIKQNVSFELARTFVRLIGDVLDKRYPRLITMEERKVEREKTGKVFVDWTQNSKAATAIVPYSLRASNIATVACPVAWEEVKKGIEPGMFSLREIEKRLKKTDDVWKNYNRKFDLRKILK